MLTIPIADLFSQSVTVQLAGQNCQISIYQRSTGLYCDLSVNNSPIVIGVICQNLNKIVRSSYLGFYGDLMFYDTQGSADPSSPGLGSRYVLCYLDASEIAQ